MSSAKDGPRVSPVLNRVRSVNRSVLSANRTRETTLGLISTSNRIRLLLFYYAVKAILNHLWDAPVPRKGFCLVFSLLVTPFDFWRESGSRCLPIFDNSVTTIFFSLFFFFLETACCGFLDINDSFQELSLCNIEDNIKIDLCNQILLYNYLTFYNNNLLGRRIKRTSIKIAD